MSKHKIIWLCNDLPSFGNKARGLAIINKLISEYCSEKLAIFYAPPLRKRLFLFVFFLVCPFLLVFTNLFLRKRKVIYCIGTDTQTAYYYLSILKYSSLDVYPYIVDNVLHEECPSYKSELIPCLQFYKKVFVVTKELSHFISEGQFGIDSYVLDFPISDKIPKQHFDDIPFVKYYLYSGSLSSEYVTQLETLVKFIEKHEDENCGLIITSDKVHIDSPRVKFCSLSFPELNTVIAGAFSLVLMNSDNEESEWHRKYSFPSKILAYGVAAKPLIYLGSMDSWAYQNISDSLNVIDSEHTFTKYAHCNKKKIFITRKENEIKEFYATLNRVIK